MKQRLIKKYIKQNPLLKLWINSIITWNNSINDLDCIISDNGIFLISFGEPNQLSQYRVNIASEMKQFDIRQLKKLVNNKYHINLKSKYLKNIIKHYETK